MKSVVRQGDVLLAVRFNIVLDEAARATGLEKI